MEAMSSPEAERFRIAVRLAETGIEIQRQNLRRRHPDLTDDEVAHRLAEWLLDRPLDVSST